MKATLEKVAKHPLFRIVIILIIAILLLTRCEYGLEHGNQQHSNTNPTSNSNTNETPHRAEEEDVKGDFREADLKFKGKKIALTKHARCRMDCREIDAYEIQEIINKNQVNGSKSQSDAPAGKCPTIAFEGRSRDNQQLRVILGDCDNPIIITVIDLKNDYNCSCK